jgi:hypothetical protein
MNDKKRISCLNVSKWPMMNRSLDRSRFKVASDCLSMLEWMSWSTATIVWFLLFFLNVCSLIAVDQFRHSNSERGIGFASISHQISMPCAKWATASTRTLRKLTEDMLKWRKIINTMPCYCISCINALASNAYIIHWLSIPRIIYGYIY